MTFGFTFVLVGAAFAADKYNQAKEKRRKLEAGEEDDQQAMMHVDFTAIELYRELVREKQGEKAATKADAEKRESMKTYLKQNMKTD